MPFLRPFVLFLKIKACYVAPMKNIFKSALIIIFLIALQIGNQKLFINDGANQWGATNSEATANMPNDDLADFIISTRAITIDKPLAEVWLWLNQLGADRSGFFSYYFIEKSMGYYTHEQAIIKADFPEFIIGDVVRGSITPENSLILYEFPVIDIKSNDYITFKNWGTAKAAAISENQTRLIIRTVGTDRGGFIANQVDYIAYALHYIMERATLMGFKKRIEFGAGKPFSALADLIWFTFIIISGLLIGALVFMLKGFKAIIIPTILSTIWLFALFAMPPTPLYSGMLGIAVLLVLIFSPKLIKR